GAGREADRLRLAHALVVEVDLLEDGHRAGGTGPINRAAAEDALAPTGLRGRHLVAHEVTEGEAAGHRPVARVDGAVHLEGGADRVVVHDRAAVVRLEACADGRLPGDRPGRLTEIKAGPDRLDLVGDEPFG